MALSFPCRYRGVYTRLAAEEWNDYRSKVSVGVSLTLSYSGCVASLERSKDRERSYSLP